MNESEHHHVELVRALAQQFKSVLEKSEQGIYLYLDDTHKVCNKKFAELLGYSSPAEWANAEAPLSDVVEADQPSVIAAYEKATEKMAASSLDIRVKNIKTGRTARVRMIMVPVTDGANHIFALHFVSRI